MNLTRRKFIKLLGTTSLAAITGRSAVSNSANHSSTEVKVAYPPTMAALPLAKSAKQKFFLAGDGVNPFLDQGIELTLIPSKGSSEAARLVSGGRADCGITGLSSSLYAIQGTGGLKITSTAFNPNETGRHLGLVASDYYDITSLTDLIENWLDGSAKNSIVLSLRRDDHYATNQLLKEKGYQGKDSVYYLGKEDLISRLFGLLQRNFKSTVLPEPLLTLSLENPVFEGQQAFLINDYANVTLPPFVFVFNRSVLEKNSELVRRFYKGWEVSLDETNESNNLQLLSLTTNILSETLPSLRNAIENTEFNEKFANLFEIPDFSGPEPLDQDVFNSVLDWAISKGYLTERISLKQAYHEFSSTVTD